MILELKGTKVTIVDKTLGYQGDNLVNTIQVTVDKDSTWNYKLDMYKGKSKCFDSVLMTRDGNVCTVQLTNEILSYGGRYIFQLRGYTDTQTYHSDIFESWVNASIEYQGDCKQACECDCKLPTEFYQVEDNVTEINNHPPYPGDNGKWMIWDVNKHEYIESDIDVVGGSGGTLYVTWTITGGGKTTADHTITEIREAYNSNKAVIGVIYADVSKTYQFVALDKIDSQEVVFSYTTYIERDLSRIQNIVVAGTDENGQDVWVIQGTQKNFAKYQLKAYMDSFVDSASVPEHYPSTKATYDYGQSIKTDLSTSIADAKKAGTDAQANLTAHINDKENPHEVTKAQVGLGNVNNTSDANKPISTATQNALNEKLDKTAVVDVTVEALKGQAADAKSVYDTIQALPTGTDISLGITSAAVGDIVKVKAVDASGKPTAWESVEMAGGSSEYKDMVTLVDDTLTDENSGLKNYEYDITGFEPTTDLLLILFKFPEKFTSQITIYNQNNQKLTVEFPYDIKAMLVGIKSMNGRVLHMCTSNTNAAARIDMNMSMFFGQLSGASGYERPKMPETVTRIKLLTTTEFATGTVIKIMRM